MGKIRIEPNILEIIIEREITKMLVVCKSKIDETDVKICKNYILKALEPYRVKDKWEVM